jgi:hypothetical protein
MHRRSFFLRVSGALASVALVGPAAACRSGGDADLATDLGAPVLLAALGTADVRALGAAYLRASPDESDLMAITRAIATDVRALRGLPWNATPSYSALVADDFANDRTVWVDGWLLSRNEARRLALFALSTPS